MGDILHRDAAYKIIGACFKVYNTMGCGFLEAVYQECLQIEFGQQGIPFKAQPPMELSYGEHTLTCSYVPDFVCSDGIIVEIKAVKDLADEHRAQLMNYVKASGCDLGLLVNFGHHPDLQHERIANTRGRLRS